jgi:phage major head subunit gpT-like protein
MGASTLGSRAIIGAFFNRLQQNIGTAWINKIGMRFESNQESETYQWLGAAPAMREWIGGRNAKGFRENGITIKNKKYEATIEVLVDELRRDKTDQIILRVMETADRTNAHWAKLLSALMVAGASTKCYDGSNFFADAHEEGDSGSQDNKVSVDISALPVGDTTGAHGSVTAPSVGEMSGCIQAAIAALLGFKDDQGEPMNEGASEFIAMVPSTLYNAALSACTVPYLPQGMNNPLVAAGAYRVTPIANVRLNSSWTDTFAVFRADGLVKPFILQEELPVQVDAIAEGSELEFNEDKHHYGVKAVRNVGYGLWQHACLVTMT